MKITASQQAALDAHLTATIPGTPATQHRAPRAFDGVIAALVDPAEIEGSHGEYQRLQPARWRVWVVTPTHLAYVEIKFDNEDDYDADEEANRVIAPGQPFIRDPARGELVSAWVRPLVTAVKLTSESIGRDFNRWGHLLEFRLQSIAIEFADGLRTPGEGSLRCGKQSHRVQGDAERWEGFIAAIREGSPYLTLELGALGL
jgi:hypothetical protein